MDTKFKNNAFIKNMHDSVREFGSIGLQMASKAVAFTATQLTSLKDGMDRYGAKLKETKPEETSTDPDKP